MKKSLAINLIFISIGIIILTGVAWRVLNILLMQYYLYF